MDFRSWLGKIHLGDTARLEVMRNGVVSKVTVPITGYDRPTVKIDEIGDATVEQRSFRERWLAATP
jgi:hypothetical protein